MLHTEAVDPSTLELLRSLQEKDYLKGFSLAGGTALALFLGHRTSVDIDLFSDFSFDATKIIELVQQDYSLQLCSTAPDTIKGIINNINVDIIAHRYPCLTTPGDIDGIRLLSEPDIIAMKLNAISVSGQRSKDFIDIWHILNENRFSVADMLNFYQTKYSQHGDMHILKSLIYFDDVDLSDWPVLLINPNLSWAKVKMKIEDEVLRFIRNQK